MQRNLISSVDWPTVLVTNTSWNANILLEEASVKEYLFEGFRHESFNRYGANIATACLGQWPYLFSGGQKYSIPYFI